MVWRLLALCRWIAVACGTPRCPLAACARAVPRVVRLSTCAPDRRRALLCFRPSPSRPSGKGGPGDARVGGSEGPVGVGGEIDTSVWASRRRRLSLPRAAATRAPPPLCKPFRWREELGGPCSTFRFLQKRKRFGELPWHCTKSAFVEDTAISAIPRSTRTLEFLHLLDCLRGLRANV